MSWRQLACAVAMSIAVTASGISYADDDKDKHDGIDPSRVRQGFEISPIPKDKLNFHGKDPYLVGLGSYLVNAAADCNGCHTFPHFLRPGGTTPGTNGNFTGNVASLGSNPTFGNPYLDPPEQPLNGQLEVNVNADTTHGQVTHTPTGLPIYQYNHFLAGGRCFGFFMSRNITPDDSGKPRGLNEKQFIEVMRTGKDVSCTTSVPNYAGVPDPVCSTREGAGAGVSFNANVLQTMSWPTYHNMTDTDLKAIYAYLSALPQSKACNTVVDGCAGWFGNAQGAGEVGTNRYRYANTDDCPNNESPTSKGDDGLPYGVSPPQ